MYQGLSNFMNPSSITLHAIPNEKIAVNIYKVNEIEITNYSFFIPKYNTQKALRTYYYAKVIIC